MMTNSARIDCDAFADRLAAHLEGELPEGMRHAMIAHGATCADCGELLGDLDVLRREAAALPVLEPSRDLWTGIAARIDAPVIPLSPERTIVRTSRRSWIRPAAAAAALVIATAGITHVLTRASFTPSGTTAPSSRVAAVSTPVADSTPAAANGRASTPDDQSAAEPSREASSGSPIAARRLVSRSSADSHSPRAERLMKEAEPVYDQEIGKLRTIVRERRGQLDPKTVAVLEQSIAVIDSAIAQSRAALKKDPASGFLAEQLNRSLDKKVELLRTAALLPART
jgi:hypothetical protein